MERQRPTIATIIKPQIADWQATVVSPTHVNLPPVKPLTLGEWAEHINQTGNLTPDDMAENIAESLVGKVFAVQKFVQVEESPGVIGNHHVTVEIGTKYIDTTGHEEYYIEYNYRTIGGETVKVGINMLMKNREPYSESASPFQISLKLELTNPHVPKFLNDLRDKNNPEELTITDADYIFNINGEYESVIATGAHDNSRQVFAILKSFVNHPKYAFLKEVFQNADLSTQRLDGLRTLDNLLKNINAPRPVNPLSLLVFSPPNV